MDAPAPLAAPKQLWLRVVSATSRTPIQDASARLAESAQLRHEWSSDAEGWICIDLTRLAEAFESAGHRLPQLNRLIVKVVAPGYSTGLVQLAEGHSVPASALTVALKSGAALELHVDDHYGRPLPLVDVRVVASGAELLGLPSEGLERGELTPATKQVVTGRFGADLALETGRFGGVMTFVRDPVLNTHRLVGGLGDHEWFGITDESGVALVEGLPASVDLRVLLVIFGAASWIEVGALGPGETRVVEWAQPAAGVIECRLFSEEFSALAKARFCLVRADAESAKQRFLSADESVVAQLTADERGRCVFEQTPVGSYFCGLLPGRYPPGLVPAQLVQLRAAGEVAQVELRVLGTNSIAGTVVDTGPFDQVFWVRASSTAIAGHVDQRCTAESGFNFEFRWMPAGDYEITGWGASGVRLEASTCRAGEQRVTLRKAASGDLERR